MRTLILIFFIICSAGLSASPLTDAISTLEQEKDPVKQSKLIADITTQKNTYSEVSSAIHNQPYPDIPKRGLFKDFTTCLDGKVRHFYWYIPESYDPKKPSRLLVWLHGGVLTEKLMEIEEKQIRDATFIQYAEKTGTIILYPIANVYATWWDNVGMTNILDLVKRSKVKFNINDNQIYLMGFSDGCSGTFAVAMLASDMFAGFVPLNGHPAIASLLGGYSTYLVNWSNKPLYVVTTDKDPLFPDSLLRPMMSVAVMAGVNLYYKVYTGMKHDLTYADVEVPNIITFIETHPRVPFPATIRWETADPKFGKCMWLSIDAVNANGYADWYQDYNITDSEGKLLLKRDKPSARVEATYFGNTFFVVGTQCSRFSLYIHPGMVQLDQPVTVYYNSTKVYEQIVKPDIDFMLKNYLENRDKSLLYCNKITIDVVK